MIKKNHTHTHKHIETFSILISHGRDKLRHLCFWLFEAINSTLFFKIIYKYTNILFFFGFVIVRQHDVHVQEYVFKPTNNNNNINNNNNRHRRHHGSFYTYFFPFLSMM